MELQQFVTESLRQILAGVAAAQKAVDETGGEVAPRSTGGAVSNRTGLAIDREDEYQPIFNVDFDVAVTAAEGTQTKGGIGVVTGFLSLGAAGQSNASNTSVSRLRFEVPIAYPRGKQQPQRDV